MLCDVCTQASIGAIVAFYCACSGGMLVINKLAGELAVSPQNPARSACGEKSSNLECAVTNAAKACCPYRHFRSRA
jgi:hypothetical protein